MSNKKRVMVIFGGQSTEHEVSRLSATSIINNIDKSKFDVTLVGITKEGRWIPYNGPVEKIASGEWEEIAINETVKSISDGENIISAIVSRGASSEAIIKSEESKTVDVVFPVLHGTKGEDGTIQGLFEIAGIPYVGCGVLGSALGMDKIYAKIIFEKAGIPQADYLYFTRKEIDEDSNSAADMIEKKFYIYYRLFHIFQKVSLIRDKANISPLIRFEMQLVN